MKRSYWYYGIVGSLLGLGLVTGQIGVPGVEQGSSAARWTGVAVLVLGVWAAWPQRR